MDNNLDGLIDILPKLWPETLVTLYMVGYALFFGGLVGLVLGIALYVTRPGGILERAWLYAILNTIVNFFRPIPFIILMAALQPLARAVIGIGIGTQAGAFVIAIAAIFGISRIVEQNLVGIPDGVIEAARSLGAGPFTIIRTVMIPEALGKLILGYTFATVAIIDMTAVAGALGAHGLGDLATQYGFRLFNPLVTWSVVLIIVAIVQIVQWFGNRLSHRVLHHT